MTIVHRKRIRVSQIRDSRPVSVITRPRFLSAALIGPGVGYWVILLYGMIMQLDESRLLTCSLVVATASSPVSPIFSMHARKEGEPGIQNHIGKMVS